MLTTPAATDAARTHAVDFFNTFPALFVENQGQWPDASIEYAYNGQGINIGFTDTGPVLELLCANPHAAAIHTAFSDTLSRLTANPPDGQRSRITMSFDGARPVTPEGVDRSATSFNYLVGQESRHRSNVAGYQKSSTPACMTGSTFSPGVSETA